MIFEGDPRLVLKDNVIDILFRSGSPVLGARAHNDFVISLGTENGWWGNAAAAAQDEQIGSDIPLLTQSAPITSPLLRQVENEAVSALSWLKSSGQAASVRVTADNPSSDKVVLSAQITLLSGEELSKEITL